MYKIQTFNKIAPVGLDRFPGNQFEVSAEIEEPNGILLRSFDLHEMKFPDSLMAIARAGAGTNNIPVDKCSEQGIVVFNTPGANANSVKELVLASLFLSSRKIVEGISWAQSVDENVSKRVEKEKSKFKGTEIKGKKLAVIGLGAIGVLVANDAAALGMEVTGYDPFISVESAWGLSNRIHRAAELGSLVSDADFITLHLPLSDQTKDLVNADLFARMKRGVRVLNFARGGLVEQKALLKALESGIVARYMTDFPTDELAGVEGVVPVPHLGASTEEAEENCAVMAADQTIDYLTAGIIRNSVNFPGCTKAPTATRRIVIGNKKVPNIVNRITTVLAEATIEISDMISCNRGEFAYNAIDTDGEVPETTVQALRDIEGVVLLRVIDTSGYGSSSE